MLEEAGVTFVVPWRATPPTDQSILGWLTVDDVREYAEFCRDLLRVVRDAVSAGSDVDETVANLALQERYRSYDLQHARSFVEAVFAELR